MIGIGWSTILPVGLSINQTGEISSRLSGNTRIRSFQSVFLIIFTLFTFCLPTGSSARAELVRTRIVFGALSGTMLPVVFAKETKIFEQYGVQAEIVYLPGFQIPIAALLSGQVDFIEIAGAGMAAASLQGADVVTLAMHLNRFVTDLVTRPEIKSPRDLLGKCIGIARFESITDYAATYIIRDLWGMKPNKDICVRAVGGLSEILAALSTGQIAGGMLSPPLSLKAISQGFKSLVSLPDYKLDFPMTGLGALRDTGKTKTDLVVRVLKSYVASIHFIKTNEQEAMKVLQKLTGVEDRALLKPTYQFYAKLFPDYPVPSTSSFKFLFEFLCPRNPKACAANPRDLIDASFVESLRKEHFVESLSGSKQRY